MINNVSLVEYFPEPRYQFVVNQPLTLLQMTDKFDIKVTVIGGGTTGQAEAVRLGIARAIIKYNEDLKPELRKAGFVTRDPREKERQKPGQPRARKQNQFSKR
jgi:small subunit ribosomal protein S9